ncbi:MAG TPA: hypothetical protein VGO50_00275 [Pyrinomonadaceae bacterium]|jgi:hypothetical protein|nr:hypothetical protein [Pyrinomonadaceae bacterium]
MSSQTRYNQILFLMTLSVYMGLLLAGGASPALAQAAMAKGFELKTELEAKDDLDKKPDNDEEAKQLSKTFEDYFDEAKDFIEDLQKLYKIEKFDTDFDAFSVAVSSDVPCSEGGGRGSVRQSEETKNIYNRWLEAAVGDAVSRSEGYNFLADCLPGNKFEGSNTVNSGIEVNYDKSILKVSVSIKKESPQKAKQLLEKLQTAYKTYEPDEDSPVEKVLYENTKITSENDQVFIVTNLPRAGLDKLLAVK